MVNIFDYSDFRKYLKDYYSEKKDRTVTFSYQYLAKKAGFNNRGFAYNIMNGKKNLSPANCFKISQALGHNRDETEYFENLVAFNQAKGLREQKHFFEKLRQIKARGKGYSKAQLVYHDQYEFYSRWYHSAVRSLIGMYGFKNDFKWLAKMVTPAITVTQARQSVELLKKLGMIKRRKNGTYGITHKSITTGKDVVRLAVQNFHDECTDLAKNALRNMAKENRSITGLTLGISKASYDRIVEETLRFQENIMDIANNDPDADRVYQYNFHIFPVSKADNGKKGDL